LQEPLVSIIIPTYNRAHLLGETLDSICSQTYQNWECIVVDDGSTDNTKALLDAYVSKDKRFYYYTRPSSFPKGANSCRNYGFDKCNGEFLNWFDSDDLMLSTNLQLKVDALNAELDFVIANSLNFDEDGNKSRPYLLDYDLSITPENFITGRIGWITNDALLRKESVKIRFNEKLRSGQEYNFFSRYLFYTTKGKYLKKDLCYRRIHKKSINQSTSLQLLIDNEIYLLQDLGYFASSKITKRSLKRIIRFSYESKTSSSLRQIQLKVLRTLRSSKKYKSIWYYSNWIIMNGVSGKGYIFIKKAISRL
jgi:glycosyltransferase involved in cell wall biosynthesis